MDRFRVLAVLFFTAFSFVGALSGNGEFSDRTFQGILSRIEALEQKEDEQTQLIQLQKRVNEEQAMQLNELRSIVQTQNDKLVVEAELIASMQEKLETQERLLAQLAQPSFLMAEGDGDDLAPEGKSGSVEEDKPLVGEVKSDINAISRKVQSQQRHRRAEGPVAFLVRLQALAGDQHLGLNQNVLFDTLVSNIGNGFHMSHGLFIAPTPGIYIFSASVNSYPHTSIEVDIVKDGTLLSRAFAWSDAARDQGSTTAVTQLAAGDEVWLRVHYPTDANIWGDAFTSFTGCLVMPL